MALWSKRKTKTCALLSIVIVICGAAAYLLLPREETPDLIIACGSDAAGMIIDYTAKLSEGQLSSVSNDISYLQLTDCCGTQAEFALAAGDFDMAVLCPDAAAQFLESDKSFEIVGGIISNANVLVTKTTATPNVIGYMNGRTLQINAVKNNLSENTELLPMMATALPYALERDAVDGVVLDIIYAITVENKGYTCTALPYVQASSVLVVRSDLIGSEAYQSFVKLYNQAVTELNDAALGAALTNYMQTESDEGATDLWRKMKIEYLLIPNQDYNLALI